MDQGSHYFAALAGWDHPWSRTDELLARVVDMWRSEKDKPFPRPWTTTNATPRATAAPGPGEITTAEATALLEKQLRGE